MYLEGFLGIENVLGNNNISKNSQVPGNVEMIKAANRLWARKRRRRRRWRRSGPSIARSRHKSPNEKS